MPTPDAPPMPTASTLPPHPACPRCGGTVACGAAQGHCACFGLALGEALRADLAARYRGCLCLDCLGALASTQGPASGSEPTPPCDAAARC